LNTLYLKTLAWFSSFPLYPVTRTYCTQVTNMFNSTDFFDVHGSVHRKCIFKYNHQQDATLHNSFISAKCSTCFRRFLRPSPGAQQLYIRHLVFVKPLLLQHITATFFAQDIVHHQDKKTLIKKQVKHDFCILRLLPPF
jgi:hypothetical protein